MRGSEGASTGRRAGRTAAVAAAAAGVLALLAGVLAFEAPEADAVPFSDGYYYTNSFWDYGTSPNANDPDHTAYNGGATTIRSVYGRVPIFTRFVTFGPSSGQDLVSGQLEEAEVGVTGVTGAHVEHRGTEFDLVCTDSSGASAYCDVPAGEYSLTLSWRGTAKEGDCARRSLYGEPPDFLPTFETCPDVPIGGTVTRRVVGGGPNDPGLPVADFSYEITDAATNEVTFTNESLDTKDGTNLESTWDFGDDEDSDETDPVHRYATGGSYQVTLSVEDSDGNTGAVTKTVELDRSLVVNSTDDDPAADAEDGCDTGQEVDGETECTLRAAIEAANAAGAGDITFDIDQAGLPSIDTSSALPELTAPAATIDGTTQAGGAVRITAGNRKKERALALAGENQKVTGLVVDQAAAGIAATGKGITVEGNVIGTDPAGTAVGKVSSGIDISGDDVTIKDNLINASVGITTTGTGTTVEGNTVGVNRAGSSLGEPAIGIAALGRDGKVQDNTVRGTLVGVLAVSGDPSVSQVSAEGTAITGNRVGVNAGGTVFADAGEGVRVDGAPRVTVADNRISAHHGAGVSVTGNAQIYSVEDEETGENTIGLYDYDRLGRSDGAVTGGNVTVSGNVIGDGALGAASPPAAAPRGVLVWEDAAHVTIRDNTIAGQAGEAVLLDDGAGHVVVGNTIGASTSGAPVPATVGIRAKGTASATLGRAELGNTVQATEAGVSLEGEGSGTIAGNRITGSGGATGTIGVATDEETGAVAVTSNAVSGFGGGIDVASSEATVKGNTVDGGQVGIQVKPAEAIITGNAVTGTSKYALSVFGRDSEIEQNVIGRTTSTGPNVGNAGDGIVIGGTGSTVTRNTVAASGGDGILVDPTARAELRGNRILATAGRPIRSSNAAQPPVVVAIRAAEGSTDRTALLVTGLPTDPGLIEVFANASCADGEAEKVLGVVKAKGADATLRIISLKDRPNDDHFTVTFTDDSKRTTELSNCADIVPFADGDGDGSHDVLDGLLGTADDPTSAVVLTDQEQLIGVTLEDYDEESGTGGGRFTSVGPEDAPPNRPAGLTLPYGLLGFTIDGLTPGGSTDLTLFVLAGDPPTGDQTYWKYGPPAADAAPAWYPFAYDPETGTGAREGGFLALPGGPLARYYKIGFVDGGRGDDDGGANGSIHDPGGLSSFAGSPEEPPVTTTTAPPPPSSTTTTTAAPAGPTTVPASPGTVSSSPPATGTLPRTGTDVSQVLALGAALVLTGSILLLARRERARHL